MAGLEVGGQAPKRARHAHPGGVNGLRLKLSGNFGKAPLHFDSRDDDFAIARIESIQCLTISLVRLGANERLERGGLI